jgi:hypothetical protein
VNFDYTYFDLFGFRLFEPLVMVTNSIIFILSLIFFNRLYLLRKTYPVEMGYFMLYVGLSTMAGGVGHAVHLQLGELFFNMVLVVMNGFSLLSVYYFFRASYTLLRAGRPASLILMNVVRIWVLASFLISIFLKDFIVIKVNAAVALIYSHSVHMIDYRRERGKGTRLVIIGILVSLLSIITHSLSIGFHEWFNHKDLSHMIMIVSLLIINRGVWTRDGPKPVK